MCSFHNKSYYSFNVAIASFVTAYAIIYMSKFFNKKWFKYNLFKTTMKLHKNSVVNAYFLMIGYVDLLKIRLLIVNLFL